MAVRDGFVSQFIRFAVFCATLHLMGLDHEELSYRYGGLDQKLTGVVPAEPIHPVLA